MTALIEQLAFDYALLDSETRIVVQQRTTEIRGLMRRAAQDIIEIGQKLIEVKVRLGHGRFGSWLEAEFEWSERTARNFMQVADQFKSATVADLIAPKALYLLAAPSTPEPARIEAIERAERGEALTYSQAKEIVAAHKPVPPVEQHAPLPILPDDLASSWRVFTDLDTGTTVVRHRATSYNVTMRRGEIPSATWAHCRAIERAIADLVAGGWQCQLDLDTGLWVGERDGEHIEHESLVEVARLAFVATQEKKRQDALREEEEPLTEYEEQILAAQRPAEPSVPSVHFSSASAEWYTPRHIIDAVMAVFDEIDLDPCSNAHGTDANVPARVHFTREDDGLARSWRLPACGDDHGDTTERVAVYMNPPYGDEIEPWIEKLRLSYAQGDITEAIALVPARTDTNWFQPLFDYTICFIKGRLKFVGNQNGGAPFPSAVVYLGNDSEAFTDVFSSLGRIVRCHP